MKKLSSFRALIIIGIAVLIILTIISMRTSKIDKNAKEKNGIAVAVDESFPLDISNEPEKRGYQFNSQPTSIKTDNKSIIDKVNSIDQEDYIFEREESENDSTDIGTYYVADTKFLEIYEPFLQEIGVSQNKIEEIYDLYMQATMEIGNYGFPDFKQDSEGIEWMLENYNNGIIDVLGEADGEKYLYFINSYTERVLINDFNNQLDDGNKLEDKQLDELTKSFYDIRVKYYDIEYIAGAGVGQIIKWKGNQTDREIGVIIENEYIDSAKNVLNETQLEMLRSILNR